MRGCIFSFNLPETVIFNSKYPRLVYTYVKAKDQAEKATSANGAFK